MRIGNPSVLALEFEPVDQFRWPTGVTDTMGYCTLWVSGRAFGDRTDGPNPLSAWRASLQRFQALDHGAATTELTSLSSTGVLQRVRNTVYGHEDLDDASARRMTNHILAPDGTRPFDYVLIVVVDSNGESRVCAADEHATLAIHNQREVPAERVVSIRVPAQDRAELFAFAINQFAALQSG